MMKLLAVSSVAATAADGASGFEYMSHIVYFVIAGKIPGTPNYIQPDNMLLLWAAVVFVLIGAFAFKRLVIPARHIGFTKTPHCATLNFQGRAPEMS